MTSSGSLTCPHYSGLSAPLSAPAAPSGTPTTGTGSLASGTYFAKVVALDAYGYTTAGGSESSPVTLSATGEIAWSWPTVTGAASYQLWVGSSSGAENTYVAVSLTSYTQTATLTAGTMPTTNSTFSLNIGNINGCVWVDGTHFAQTNTGIQNAVYAAGAGGCVYLPPATYLLSSGGTEQILITAPIDFECGGWGANLQVQAGVPTTTDVIHIKPSGLVRAVVIENCQFTVAANGVGRYPISIDPQSTGANQISNSVFRHNFVDASPSLSFGGAYSLAVINPASTGSGAIWGSKVEDNEFLNGGILLLDVGDSNNFIGNIVSGPASGTTAGFELTQNSGASTNTFLLNNITTAGGCFIAHGATEPKFVFNQCEATQTSTESNSAMVDLMGDSYTVTDALVMGNNLNASSGGQHANINVRVGNSTNARVDQNTLTNSNTAGDGAITTTASAILTQIPFNSLSGTAAYLKDSGTSTSALALGNNLGLNQYDDTGTLRTIAETLNTGQVNYSGYHGSQFLAGANGANYIYDSAGNPVMAFVGGGSNSSVPASGTMANLYSLGLANMLLSKTAPTIASGFGTSPSIAKNNGAPTFTVNVGTGGTASSGTIGLPTAANGWYVWCQDESSFSTTVFITRQTGGSTTSVSIANYSSSAVLSPWASGDTLSCGALAY
jgi:hypothetical protein